ncbi:MAG: OFA family MFS transporter [Candidatus Caldatribacterium sp.]|nr:OFA family MFS transporter [Candidatus Caldatribacterium sp.]
MKRIGYVILGIGLLLCLGTVYSYSVFRKPIEETFRVGATLSGLPYMLALFFYALFMPLGGRLLRRLSPRVVALLGSVATSTGWIGAGLSRSYLGLVLFYGVLCGAGVGIAYGVPLAVSVSWFPENPGLALGSTVVGFGLSPLVTAPLARRFVEMAGPLFAFRVLGWVFLAATVPISLLLRFHESKSTGFQNTAPSPRTNLLRQGKFWALWTSFFIGTFIDLSAISITGPIAQETIGLPYQTAALSVSIFAVFNGVGRPLFGYLVDRKGFKRGAFVSYSSVALASLLFFAYPHSVTYALAFAVLWMNLGAWLAMAPTTTYALFGPETYAQNYGVVFTAYGVGALAGTFVSGVLRDLTGSYLGLFPFNALLAGIGIGIVSILEHLSRREEGP